MSNFTNKIFNGHYVNEKIMSIFTGVTDCKLTRDDAYVELANLSKIFNFDFAYTNTLRKVIDEFYDNELN